MRVWVACWPDPCYVWPIVPPVSGRCGRCGQYEFAVVPTPANGKACHVRDFVPASG